MFEKEAEEWIKNNLHSTEEDYIKAFKDGAEFGYNKAKEDADKMKSQFLELCNLKDMRIAELEKANEWHYMKDVKYNDPQFLEGRQPRGGKMTVQWDRFRYYCPKCFNAFLLETKNKEYNVEVKCPKCGFILRKKSEVKE